MKRRANAAMKMLVMRRRRVRPKKPIYIIIFEIAVAANISENTHITVDMILTESGAAAFSPRFVKLKMTLTVTKFIPHTPQSSKKPRLA